MRLRFKSMLALILILIITCAFIGVGYLFYTEVIISSDIVVDGDITINYLNGNNFKLNGDATMKFSITNNDSSQKYYYIQLTDVYAKDVNYELTSSSNLEISNVLKSDIISNQIAINGNETVEYTLKFTSHQNEEYSGSIQIGVKNNEENTFIDVIMANTKISDTSLTSMGEPATLDEGLLTAQDDLGVAYYFRGAVTNNNVSFARYNWKIVKINGDGSIKLVLDGIIDEIGKYYDGSIEFIESKINTSLNDWFNTNLTDYTDYIAYYKYCNDTILETDNITYTAYNRILTNNIPTFVCLGGADNAKIGLLTADEVMLAGGSKNANNSYYLYNSNITSAYFTMTSAKFSGNDYYPFAVNTDGSLIDSVSGTLLRGIRPVINIIKNARVSGSGTLEDPYEIILN